MIGNVVKYQKSIKFNFKESERLTVMKMAKLRTDIILQMAKINTFFLLEVTTSILQLCYATPITCVQKSNLLLQFEASSQIFEA